MILDQDLNFRFCFRWVTTHRRTGNFLSGGGAVIHLPKKFLQVVYKTVEHKRGPYDATT